MRVLILLSIVALTHGFPNSDSTTGQNKLSDDPRIIIVGAGVSGIAAATRLIENGFSKVLLLEAENRIGGRVNTVNFGKRYVDLGAHWVHGEKGNIVYEIANKMDLLYHSKDHESLEFYFDDGDTIPTADGMKLYDSVHEAIEDKEQTDKYKGNMHDFLLEKGRSIAKEVIKDEKAVDAYMLWLSDLYCTLEGCNKLTDVSVAGRSSYVDAEGDTLVTWKDGGYNSIIQILLKTHPKLLDKGEKPINITSNLILNCEVQEIDWSGEEAKVKCVNSLTHTADHVIVTTSVGVLKGTYSSMFKPQLPQEKINAIKGIGFGVVAKVYLYFGEEWWPKNCSGFNFIFKNREGSNEGYSWEKGLLGFYKESSAPGVLGGWMIGEDAKNMEMATDEQVKEGAFRVLKKFLGKKYTIPEPLDVKRSQWYSNVHFKGVYSYRSMETEALKTGAKDLGKPVTNAHNKEILMFAGEATNEIHYSTVHGALETGWREADRLIKKYT